MTTDATPDEAREPVEAGRIACICGASVWAENWANHLFARRPQPPHAPVDGPDSDTGLTAEETALLARLDALEADDSSHAKIARSRVEQRLTDLAQGDVP